MTNAEIDALQDAVDAASDASDAALEAVWNTKDALYRAKYCALIQDYKSRGIVKGSKVRVLSNLGRREELAFFMGIMKHGFGEPQHYMLSVKANGKMGKKPYYPPTGFELESAALPTEYMTTAEYAAWRSAHENSHE